MGAEPVVPELAALVHAPTLADGSEVGPPADALVDVERPATEADAGGNSELGDGAEEPAAPDVDHLQEQWRRADDRRPASPPYPVGELGRHLAVLRLDRLTAAHRAQQLPAAGPVEAGERGRLHPGRAATPGRGDERQPEQRTDHQVA